MHVIVSWNYKFDISLLSVFCSGLGLGLEGYGLGLEAQVLCLGLGVSGLVNITVSECLNCSTPLNLVS